MDFSKRGNEDGGTSLLTSQMTEKATGINNDEEAAIIEISENFFFPFFAEITSKAQPHFIVCLIQVCLNLLQTFSINLFIGSDYSWEKAFMPEFLKKIAWFVHWGLVDTIKTDNFFIDSILQYFLFIGLFIVQLIYLLSISFYYYKTRSTKKWQLHIARVIFNLFPALTISGFSMAGYSVVNVNSHSSSSNIFLLIVMVIMALVYGAELVNSHIFLSNSAHVPNSLTGHWDCRPSNLHFLLNATTAFLIPTLNLFPMYLLCIYMVVAVALHGYICYLTFFMPFISAYSNSFFMGMSSFTITGILINFVGMFIQINWHARILFPIVVFFVSLICFKFYYMRLINNVKTFFTIPPEKMSKKEIYEFYDQMIFSSSLHLRLYFRIGLEKMFFDFSFVRYLAENYAQPEVIIALIRVTTFFPNQHQLLSFLLKLIKQFPNLEVGQKFLIFQVRKIYLLRESATTVEASKSIEILKSISCDTISQVRGFWMEILHSNSDVSIASLNYINKISNRTNILFIDAMEMYPNSVDLHELYMNFLIDGLGDFMSALRIANRMKMINQGKQVVRDEAFFGFISTFPVYLQNEETFEMLNKVMKNLTLDSGDIESIENFERDDIMRNVMKHSLLRIQMKASTKDYYPKSFNILYFLILIEFFGFMLLFIMHAYVVDGFQSDPNELMQSNSNQINMYYTYFLAAAGCATTLVEVKLNQSLINRTLLLLGIDTPKTKLSNLSIFYDQVTTIHHYALDWKVAFNDQMTLLHLNNDLHGRIMNQYNVPNYYTRYFLPFQGLKWHDMLSNYMRDMVTQCDHLEAWAMFYYNYPELRETYYYGMATVVYDARYIINFTTEYFRLNYGLAENIIDKSFKRSSDLILVVTIIFGIIMVLVELYQFFEIFWIYKKASAVMRRIPEHVMQNSLQPIFLKNKSNKITITATHSAHDKSYVLFLFAVTIILSIGSLIAGFVALTLYIKNRLYFIKKLFRYSMISSQRMAYMQAYVINFVLNQTDYNKDPIHIDFHMMRYILETINTESIQLDIELVGQNSDFDAYYFSDLCSLEGDYNVDNFLFCVGRSKKMALMKFLMDNLLFEYEKNQEESVETLIYLLYWMMDNYIMDDLKVLQEKIQYVTSQNFSEMTNNTTTWTIVLIVFIIIIFGINMVFIRYLKNSYDAFKQLILFLDPIEVSRMTFLLEMILGNDDEDESYVLRSSDIILESFEDGIAEIDSYFSILKMNDGITRFFGLLKDQILGRSLLTFIPENIDNNFKNNNNSYYFGKNNKKANNRSSSKSSSKSNIRLNNSNNSSANLSKNTSANNLTKNTSANSLTKNTSANSLTKNSSSNVFKNINNPTVPNFKIILEDCTIDNCNNYKNTSMINSNNNDKGKKGNNEENENENENDIIQDIEFGQIKQNGNARFYSKLYHMFNKSDIKNFIEYVNILLPDFRFLPAKVTVTRNGDNAILFLHDLRAEYSQKRQITEIKKRIDKISTALIPEIVMNQLIQNETDMTTRVLAGTVICIEIKSIADTVFTMDAKQVMDNINSIYSVFEMCNKKHPIILPFRQDFEIYYACVGVFSHVGEMELQTYEAIEFCVDVLNGLDSVNEQWGTEVVLEMSVHTGGPIVGYVRNNEMPSIEILGDMMRYTIKAQEFGERNVIQATESVVMHVDIHKYNVIPGYCLALGQKTEQVFYIYGHADNSILPTISEQTVSPPDDL